MQARKLILANSIGTILEVYDISIYAFFAPVIAANFFPSVNKSAALLNTLLIFMVSFIVRPIGAVIFGHIGDTIGRKKTLVITISLISGATLAIGLLPNAMQIGFLAPLLLLVFRVLQGLSFSVEFIGALVFLAEQAPRGRKGFIASFAICGGNIGLLLASLGCCFISYYCSKTQLYAWGWRLPFLLAAIGGMVSLYFRYRITENTVLNKADIIKFPLARVMQQQKTPLFILFSLACFYMVVCYLIYICSPTYLVQLAKISMSMALTINSAVLLMQVMMVPLLGWWSDKINKRTVLLISIVVLIMGVYPYYAILQTGNLLAVIVAHVGMSFVAIFFTTMLPIMLTEMMPVNMRISGLALGYNVAASLAGGITPVAAIYILKLSHGVVWLSAYFIFWAAQALVGMSYWQRRQVMRDVPGDVILVRA